MDNLKEFQTILQIIISRLVEMISKEMNIIDKEAIDKLYKSELYEKLENEETKIWHLSVPTLYSLFDEEQKTGKITFPEEA